ncbi:MAG TPA: thiamine pyrophosphate-binding protein [Bryobacteraceae bacterium]|nr:thiamine pyrophosphate-binding protein [Bryobacteraceae bacterium]
MANHAEAMAQTLAARGVEYVFGLPGGEIVAFIDACRRSGLRFLLTGHEASAAWMAQVVGQITGVPGVCASTLGPGATNLITGVANAFLDRAPMLAVTAQIPSAALATMTHQRLPLNDLFSPIAKGSFRAGDFDTIQLMNHAMDLATAPRPGPVHVSLGSDLAVQEYSAGTSMRAVSITPNSAHIDQIAGRLQTAARPLVLIGLGATPSTGPAIRAFVERLQAPFLVTPKVKGIVPEDHPLFAGVASGMAMDRPIVEAIKSADLIVAIGFDPVECDKTWFAEVNVVALDTAPMAEGSYAPLEAIGDLAPMLDELSKKTAQCPNWLPALPLIQQSPTESPGPGLSPLRVIEELRSVFPRDGIATCDVGSHKLVMGQFWRAYEPGTFFMSNGLSGMGFGIPAAIAAQLTNPEKPVLAVVGDGGMLMMLHDLVLIRELALPILMVVLSDRSLSLIRVSAERRGFPPYGVDFTPPDFAAVAQGFGIAARRIASLAELRTCVDKVLSQRIPFLIDIPIDYREYYSLV